MAPSSSRDRITVDLRGLRAALFTQARAQGVSPSNYIRAVLGEALREDQGRACSAFVSNGMASGPRKRLSLRMQPHEAQLVLARAQAAGLAPGAFVALLCTGVPSLLDGQRTADQVAALTASSAELATLARDLRHLTQLLRDSEVRAARAYRDRLQQTERDVREHLAHAAALMAELKPQRRRCAAGSADHRSTT